MKSFVVAFVCVSCLFVAIRAAAVEPVVAELQKDNSKNDAAKAELPKNEDCIQPKETGRCFALFYRFAYDVEKGKCEEFIYGGCAGNSNNFETKIDCEEKCVENKQTVTENDGVLITTVSPNSESEGTTENVAGSS